MRNLLNNPVLLYYYIAYVSWDKTVSQNKSGFFNLIYSSQLFSE